MEIFRRLWANFSVVLATSLFFGAIAAVCSVFVLNNDKINPILNTVAAMLVGFLLVFIILIIRVLTDSTVRRPEDIVEQLGTNLLGVIPKSEGERR